jgi:hypothetical protein
MNNVFKTILVFVLTSLMMFSSLMIHIYNTTSVDYNGSVGTPLTTDEIVMYDMYIYILSISTLGLLLYWGNKQLKNNN